MIQDPIRTVILPILLLTIVVIIGLYLHKQQSIVKENFAGSLLWGSPSSGNTGGSNAGSNAGSNVGSSNVGSNVGSNVRGGNSYNVYNILNNILPDDLADRLTGELQLDVKYDGHRRKKWPRHISHEHEEAEERHHDWCNRYEEQDKHKNKLLNDLGRTTASQIYYDDEDEDEDEDEECDSPSLKQGSHQRKTQTDRKCPRLDTSEYIEKDKVPCWNCDLD